MKKRFKGIYKVCGELLTLYVWAWSERQAHILFKRNLEKKLGRKLYFKYIQFQIKEE